MPLISFNKKLRIHTIHAVTKCVARLVHVTKVTLNGR